MHGWIDPHEEEEEEEEELWTDGLGSLNTLTGVGLCWFVDIDIQIERKWKKKRRGIGERNGKNRQEKQWR